MVLRGSGGDLDEDYAGRGFVDHDWIVFGQCEGRSGWYAGAAAPGRWCVLWRFGRLVSCGRQVASSVRFFLPCFPHKQGIVQFVWFLGPVFLINWVNSILSIRAVDIDHVKLKKKTKTN